MISNPAERLAEERLAESLFQDEGFRDSSPHTVRRVPRNDGLSRG